MATKVRNATELGERTTRAAAQLMGVDVLALEKAQRPNVSVAIAKGMAPLYLTSMHGMTQAGASYELGMSESTLNGRMRRARKLLTLAQIARNCGEMHSMIEGGDASLDDTQRQKIGSKGVTTWSGTGKDFDAWCKERDMRFGQNAASIGDVKVNA